ncbi:MAG: hypothetical protein FI734_02675 [SAR202 cluster bacterium]|nr:hypothetical protein [SAR202 cluster bacterium]|tara:strand:+ start:148 stop:369 length:222 start_codon:yes stop_codon:yes gene_type:complete
MSIVLILFGTFLGAFLGVIWESSSLDDIASQGPDSGFLLFLEFGVSIVKGALVGAVIGGLVFGGLALLLNKRK